MSNEIIKLRCMCPVLVHYGHIYESRGVALEKIYHLLYCLFTGSVNLFILPNDKVTLNSGCGEDSGWDLHVKYSGLTG